jgi:hypothetical protein
LQVLLLYGFRARREVLCVQSWSVLRGVLCVQSWGVLREVLCVQSWGVLREVLCVQSCGVLREVGQSHSLSTDVRSFRISWLDFFLENLEAPWEITHSNQLWLLGIIIPQSTNGT